MSPSEQQAIFQSMLPGLLEKQQGPGGSTFVDADTVRNKEGQLERLAGLYAPETTKVAKLGQDASIMVPGQDVGEAAAVAELARRGDFTEVEPTGQTSYGRPVVERKDAFGRSLSDVALMTGAVRLTGREDPKVAQEARMSQQAARIVAAQRGEQALSKEHQIGQQVQRARQDNLQFFSGAVVDDPQTYAAMKGLSGIAALQDAQEAIDEKEAVLRHGLLNGLLRPSEAKTKAIQKEIQDLREKAHFIANNVDFVAAARSVGSDRNIMNESKAPVEHALLSGFMDLRKAAWGFMEQTGDSLQGLPVDAAWSKLSEWGRAGVARNERDMGQLPTWGSLHDLQKQWSSDDKAWNKIGDTFTWVGTSLAGMVPHMALFMLGWPGLAASGLAYSGGIYAEQDEDKKNPLLALTYGTTAMVLDAMSFGGMTKAGGAALSVLKAEDRKIIKDAYIQQQRALGKNVTDQMAEAELQTRTKQAILTLVDDGQQLAKRNAYSKEALLRAGREMGEAAMHESGTEVVQQALEMAGKTGDWWGDEAYFDRGFRDALTEAAVAGGVIGAGFKAVGSNMDMLQWRNLAQGFEQAKRTKDEGVMYQNHQRSQNPQGAPNLSLSERLDQGITEAGSRGIAVEELSKLKGAPKGVLPSLLRAVADPMQAFRSLARTFIPTIFNEEGQPLHTLALLRGLLEAGTLVGDHYDGKIQKYIANWGTKGVDFLSSLTHRRPQEINDDLRAAWSQHWREGRNQIPLTGDKEVDARNAVYDQWWQEVRTKTQRIMDQMREDGLEPTDYLQDVASIFTDTLFDSKEVRANYNRLVEALKDTGVAPRIAKLTIDELLGGTREGRRQAKEVLESSGLLADPKFSDIFHPNVLQAFENYKANIAKAAVRDRYFGRKGEKLGMLIELAYRRGEIDEARKELMIRHAQDIFDIANHDYHSLRNHPFLEKVNAYGATMVQLAFLGKAAISSIPEVGVTTVGTPEGLITKQVGAYVSSLKAELKDLLNQGISYIGTHMRLGIFYRNSPEGKAAKEMDELKEAWREAVLKGNAVEAEKLQTKIDALFKKTLGLTLYSQLGYDDSGFNTQARYEIGEYRARRMLQFFVKVTGLEAQTDATRIGQLAVAGDVLRTHLMVLQNLSDKTTVEERVIDRRQRILDNRLNEFERESLTLLTNYGADVEQLLQLLDELAILTDKQYDDLLLYFANEGDTQLSVPHESWLDHTEKERQQRAVVWDQYQTVLRNMVDARMANPGIVNQPKFMMDPRLKLVTVMGRFIATFTASILPKLYRDYLKEGNRHMRWQAFQGIAFMIFLGHLSSLMKDLIGNWDDENPYIKTNRQKVQRALYGSGLLGSAQGLVDSVVPLYDFQRKDPSVGQQILDFAEDKSPFLAWGGNLVSAMHGLATKDDAPRHIRQALRSAPLVGSIPAFGRHLEQKLKEE